MNIGRLPGSYGVHGLLLLLVLMIMVKMVLMMVLMLVLMLVVTGHFTTVRTTWIRVRWHQSNISWPLVLTLWIVVGSSLPPSSDGAAASTTALGCQAGCLAPPGGGLQPR